MRRTQIAALALLLAFCGVGTADPLAPGAYSGRFNWTFEGKAYAVGSVRQVMVGNLGGVSTNNDGSGFLHNARVDCQIFWDIKSNASTANGSCIVTDERGDKAIGLWRCSGPVTLCSGKLEWDGGTGAFAGLSGYQDFQAMPIGQSNAGYSQFKGEWHLK